MTLVEPTRRVDASLFTDRLGRFGEQPALLTATRSITYAELDDLVTEASRRLGTERRLVLVAAANTVEALVAYLAALRGAHPVLLAGSDARSVDDLAATYDVDVVVSADTGWDLDERRTSPGHELHPDLAVLLSTSGSTGSPKLVRLSRENLHTNATAIAAYLNLSSTDRAITTLPMQYCYGLSVINSHLHSGAGIVLTELSVIDDAFWRLFREAHATSIAGVPHTFELLDRAGFADLSLPSLRYLTQAGGRMDPDTVRRFAKLGARRGWDLFVMYGQTEATARMAYLPPSLAATHPHTIGVPIPGGRLTIDQPDEAGIGELVYEGPNVMLGYAEQSGDLALGRTFERLTTGDLARATPDGLYEIVGRRKRFIKPYGLRIDLDRVERLLGDNGIPAMCLGDDAELILAVGHAVHADAAVELVVQRTGLPRHHVRVVTGELPRLANGKPDYERVRQRALDAHQTGGTGRRGDAVTVAFAEVLGIEPASDDTFVSLGGDSLSYVELSIRLENILGALPRDWHTTRIGGLERSTRPRSRLAATDVTVVLRAVGIILIVGTHVHLWHVPGGAHTLLAVAGYNFGRFQTGFAATLGSIGRVALPSMCWIAAVASVSDKYGWPNALLINGIVQRPGDHWGYWFIEALIHILVPLALVLAVPTIARLDRRRPLAVPATVLALGLLVRFEIITEATSHRTSLPAGVLWLFALGWCASRATTIAHRLLLSAVAAVSVPGFFDDTGRELVIVVGILLSVWAPAVRMPRTLARAAAAVAGASLYIYLVHWQVFPPIERLHGPAAAVAGSVLAGLAIWVCVRRLVARTGPALRLLAGRAARASRARMKVASTPAPDRERRDARGRCHGTATATRAMSSRGRPD